MTYQIKLGPMLWDCTENRFRSLDRWGFEVVENVAQTQAVAEFIAMLHRWHVFHELTREGEA